MLFAEAVSRWHWAPEELKDVAAYWRGTLRLELRCQSRPAPKTLDEPFHQEAVRWLAKISHLGAVPAGDAAALDHAALSSTDSLAELIFPSALHPLSSLSYADGEQALTAAGAPASVHAMVVYVYASMHAGGGIRESAGRKADNLGKLVPAFLERAPKEKASYWLELEWALALESAGRFAQAQPLVAQVVSTPETVLPADDPIRQVGQLHAALIAAQLGTPAAASSTAGLDAQQCSLLDTHPVPTKAGLSSDVFPKEALRWGFEGHVEEEFDIGSDGRVAHVRTVLAYPPFIFGPDTERAIHDFRYVPPSIGGKAVGCNSQTVRINYRLPG